VESGKQIFRVMIVDDEPEIAAGIADLLSLITNYHIEPFADPHLAMGAFQDNPYHLVLTDLRMPKIEGTELVRRIKEINPTTEIIVMTALKDEEMIEASKTLGVNEIFYKPVDLTGIEEAVVRSHEKYMQTI
jgi:YesN/AraC family two-component response regulator